MIVCFDFLAGVVWMPRNFENHFQIKHRFGGKLYVELYISLSIIFCNVLFLGYLLKSAIPF